jgi:hypothetical protein
VRTTARLNAIQIRYWRTPDPVFDVEQEVDSFLQDAQGPLRAALHIVGDDYNRRKVAMPVSLPLPSLCYTANTLALLSRIYQQPLAEFQRLNPDWDADQILPPETPVNVPDPDFGPLAVSRLAAEALVSNSLSPAERSYILQSLIPIAASDPTVLYNLLGRMLLSAGLDDPKTISSLSGLIPGVK